jgi:hypothetical protein
MTGPPSLETQMNGVLLFGWSTAAIFEVLRRTLTASGSEQEQRETAQCARHEWWKSRERVLWILAKQHKMRHLRYIAVAA